jgi:4-carboxymuconolactone decarboxylase
MRLPPIPPDDLTPEQRTFYDEMQAGIAVSYRGVQSQDERGALVGPFNPWLHFPEIGETIWKFNRAIARLTSLPDRPREVATLVVGGHYRATYEVESHRVYAARVGFSPAEIDALVAGRAPEGLNEQERCAFDMASALCAGGVVPEPLYQQGVRQFGPRGIGELVYLCAFYAVACMTMNAFDVAGPETP